MHSCGALAKQRNLCKKNKMPMIKPIHVSTSRFHKPTQTILIFRQTVFSKKDTFSHTIEGSLLDIVKDQGPNLLPETAISLILFIIRAISDRSAAALVSLARDKEL